MVKFFKVLLIIILISVINITYVFAINDDVNDTIYKEAADYLISYGIMSGYPDGTFKPFNDITRAEVTVVIMRALGYDLYDTTKLSNFSDMRGHWADKYVAASFEKNIVSGYPDGTFRPNNNVSFQEIATLYIKMAGLSGEVSTDKGWPENYIEYAIENNIIKGLNINDWTAKACRGDAAIMLYNTLNILKGYDKIGVTRVRTSTFISDGLDTPSETVESENQFPNNLNYNIGLKTTLEHSQLDISYRIPVNYRIYYNNNIVYQKTETVDFEENTSNTIFYTFFPIQEFSIKLDGEYKIEIISNQNLIYSRKIELYTDYSYEKSITEQITVNSLKFFSSSSADISKGDMVFKTTFEQGPLSKYIWWALDISYPDLKETISFPIHFEYYDGGVIVGDHKYDRYLYSNANSDILFGGIVAAKTLYWMPGDYTVKIYAHDIMIAEGSFTVTRE